MNTIWYKNELNDFYNHLNFTSILNNTIPIYIYQNDFKEGTYRITKPGLYTLNENIIFHPNPDNDFKPTMEQFKNNTYPPHPYRLGFFAAITIECKDVILDLNGYSISQSVMHNLKQRFFALIELANTPFIPNTGPTNFGMNINAASNSIIKNGHLGLSSHHGIHGNNNDYILIHDITYKDFEVAAISLNGGNHIYIKESHIQGTNTNITSNAMLSQCLFALPFLKKIKEKHPDAFLQTKRGKKCIQSIINDVTMDTENFLNSIINDDIYYDSILSNPSGLLDGNVYGIVLNSTGPVVGAFKDISPLNTRNAYVIIENVIIENITSDSVEIIGYGLDKSTQDGSYGKDQLIGPVGDIIQFENVLDDKGFYVGNILTDMQLIINKYGSNQEDKGRANVPLSMIESIEACIVPVPEIKKEEGYYCINGRDSMGHHMKGSAGLFISQGQYIMLNNLTINNIINNGIGDTESCETSGILLSGTKNLIIKNNKITNIKSIKNRVKQIRYKLENNNICII